MRIIKTRTERGRPGTEARKSECHVCVRTAARRWPAIGSRSEIEKPRGFRTALVWRRTERDHQVVFSNIEVRVKRGGHSGLGHLEVTEYITRIRSGLFERKDGTSVHLATTEARFMPD